MSKIHYADIGLGFLLAAFLSWQGAEPLAFLIMAIFFYIIDFIKEVILDA